MEGISRKMITEACEVLRTSGNEKLADDIEKYDIIPKLYAYTYLKRIYQEVTGGLDETFDEMEMKIDSLEGLDMEYINRNSFKAIKKMLKIAFDRENYICDFDDSKNPAKKFGICQCESHSEKYDDNEEEASKEQKLTLILMPDEFNKKMDDQNPEYWCQACADEAEPDCEVTCDMDIEA